MTVDEQGSLEGVHGDLHGIRQIGVIGIPVLVLFWALAIGAALNYRNAIRSTRLKQLQQKNEEKNQFLATMSHELRTPLTAVIGMSAQLERETFGPLNDKQAEYVSHIARSGGHLLSLIDDLLDLERVEAGKDDLTLEHLSVAAVVADSLTLVREMAASREVNLVADLPDDLPLLIGDERRVKQIFVNLLSNAITFTPVGGSIGVETTTGESTIGVTVWDTGRGISAEDLTRIFEPFEKSGTEVDSRGRGLGLALTTQLVKLHGGTISVTSDIGVGSRFTVSLPTAQTPSIAEEQQADTAPAFPDQPSDGNKRVRVLVAEDHEINRRLFTDTLSVAGFEVAIAENGREAVERAGTFRPDVVLMDIRMPVMGGLEATRLLKASASTRDIAVIALTAQGVSNDEEQCHEAGCDAYLSKPVDPAEIIRVVRSFTDAPQTDRALTSRLV